MWSLISVDIAEVFAHGLVLIREMASQQQAPVIHCAEAEPMGISMASSETKVECEKTPMADNGLLPDRDFETISSPSSPYKDCSPLIGTRSKHGHTISHKGLRLYGRLVLNKLKQKATTNFEEVVCEIHNDLIQSGLGECTSDKSTRRRVYDVLNVFFALGMVSKDGKNISLIKDHPEEFWQENELEKEKKLTEKAMELKKTQLKELLLQTIAYKSLLLIRRDIAKQHLSRERIELPFVIIKTPKNTTVNCSLTEDRFQHLFSFEQPFEIHDNIDVLKRMGLAFGLHSRVTTIDQLAHYETMVSKELEKTFSGLKIRGNEIYSKATTPHLDNENTTQIDYKPFSSTISSQMFPRAILNI